MWNIVGCGFAPLAGLEHPAHPHQGPLLPGGETPGQREQVGLGGTELQQQRRKGRVRDGTAGPMEGGAEQPLPMVLGTEQQAEQHATNPTERRPRRLDHLQRDIGVIAA